MHDQELENKNALTKLDYSLTMTIR